MLRRFWRSARVSERWDLYGLACIALASFILEVTTKYNGVSLLTIALVPLTVVLLRLRENVEHMRDESPVEHLSFDWFRDFNMAVSRAREIWFYTGGSISSLIGRDTDATRRLLHDLCEHGVKIRVLISEPAASSYQSSRALGRISQLGPSELTMEALAAELDALAELIRPDRPNHMTIHVTDYPQPQGLLFINPNDYDGTLVVVLPEFNPQERLPTLNISADLNRQSFAHFIKEAGRLWDAGSTLVDT